MGEKGAMGGELRQGAMKDREKNCEREIGAWIGTNAKTGCGQGVASI